MNYLDALFKDIPTDSYKTNKVRRKAWGEHSWIQSGEHGQMKNIKYAFQMLKNLERCQEAIRMNTEFNKANEFTKEQENFKKSLVYIGLHEYPEECEHYLYNKAKAELYNIEWDYDVYDPIGLAQAIDQYEWSEKRDKYNNDREYYNNLGVR